MHIRQNVKVFYWGPERKWSFHFYLFLSYSFYSLFLQMFHAMLCYAKSLQSWPTLCDPIDRSPPGSPVPGILQARTLEWVAISFSNA